ncbi:MAG: hypothetical protein AB7L84_08690 [Acidimicrobiia bacterium]
MADAVLASDQRAALHALRARRSARRTGDVHWIDVLYQAYLTGIIVVLAVVFASGWVGDDPVSAAGVARIRTDGPAVVGLVVALAVAVGLRSGSRGGPLALEEADVRHVMLAPLPLGTVLRAPALRQLQFLVFAGAAVGGVAGQLAFRRLDGNAAAWIGSGALLGATTAALAVGLGWVAAGRRLDPRLCTAVGLALVGWDALDLAGTGPVAPTSVVGRMAVWDLRLDPLALVGVVVAVVAVAVGLAGLGGLSLESAQRRSALVGQLRFAATMRDLRTVIVLRRQLAQERPRTRPWLRARRRGPATVVARGWRSLLRTPAGRVARVVALAAGAGLAAKAAWEGTTPMLLVAGLATFVAALDVIEPLAQEVDHPTVLDLAPVERGAVHVRHLVVPGLAMVAAGVVALGAVAVTGLSAEGAEVAALTVVPAALAAVAGAVVSVVRAAPGAATNQVVMASPEAAGMHVLFQTAIPPALAVAGFLPVVLGRSALDAGESAAGGAWTGVMVVGGVVVLVAGWVRQRDRIAEWMEVSRRQAGAGRIGEG